MIAPAHFERCDARPRLVWSQLPPAARPAAARRRRVRPERSNSPRIVAIYDLKLTSSRGKRLLEGARGRIVYDFSGSACEGYALQFRQVTELDKGEGKVSLSDLRTTTWEEGDGKSFRFKSQNYMDQKQVSDVDGRADRAKDKVAVKLDEARRQEVRRRHRWCSRPSTCAC